jgi:beta-glucanase (GH16 family)
MTSARLHTIDTFTFTYGIIEVRARIPVGDWIWPGIIKGFFKNIFYFNLTNAALWMMPKDNSYGGWPTSGEIDIMESRGNRGFVLDNGVHIGVEQVNIVFSLSLHI